VSLNQHGDGRQTPGAIGCAGHVSLLCLTGRQLSDRGVESGIRVAAPDGIVIRVGDQIGVDLELRVGDVSSQWR